ncbi:hypothetical protein BCR32DRAFT_230296 [Anaeromyces robustus]|uniref:CBM10 domain-containing protein n=1 Tax=Anaeromyces robustus TaxID=1754192 RepID=A0A1Y1XFW3_9FUNG|nr:hypothetical protein BCR32DRAFT_230296 [Anaeromyces robustus]|eukprot:ORX84649.1 hypothetical protein BCR32DRAFT_230296 [Anaeromyces robustus]
MRVTISPEEYEDFFISRQCERDTTPGFLKRNEACYTAHWVDLNQVLSTCIQNKYIDISKITPKDKELVDKVTGNTNSYNITLSEFENIITTYSDFKLEEILSKPYRLLNPPSYHDFVAEKARMTFEFVEGKKKNITEFEKVKFSVGGNSSKMYSKLSYNLNIKSGTLFGSKQLRLRSEPVDPAFIREKLAYDLHTVIGLPSLSANFAKLYINDEYMGFYLLRDAFKSKWVEQTFGEKSTKHIYKCGNGDNPFFNCSNDDEDMTEDKEWEKFLDRLDKAKTRQDLEEFFDVDTFIKWQASRYLFGSLDHQSGRNNNAMYMYHNVTNGKDIWIPLLYDFDMNFGNFRVPVIQRNFTQEIVDPYNPLYEILNLNDESEELKSIFDDIMRQVFNPLVMLARIDQLKYFLKQYIKEDRTPDAYGHRPGRFNLTMYFAEDLYTYDDFKKNSDYTTVKSRLYYNNFNDYSRYSEAVGIKRWVIERFQYVCDTYQIDCDYAKEIIDSQNYKVTEINREQRNEGCKGTGYPCCILESTAFRTYDRSGYWGLEGGNYCLIEDYPVLETCWSEALGYPCCRDPRTTIYKTEKDGKEWGIESNQWCGINEMQGVKKCPGYAEGYNCCKNCEVTYISHSDPNKKWGFFSNGDWCSIPYSCDKK